MMPNRNISLVFAGAIFSCATLWAASPTRYTVTDIGSGPIQPTAINDAGQVGGALYGGKAHAFLYSNGVLTDLSILEGWDESYALGMNRFGQLVGAFNLGSVATNQAFLYSAGAV